SRHSGFADTQLDVGSREAPQHCEWRAIARHPADTLELLRGQCAEGGSDRPKSQPVVEPERTGREALAITAAELRWFGNEMVDAKALAVDPQYLAEQVG